MQDNQKTIALVEAIGTASQFVTAFNERGFNCLNILSQNEVLPIFKPVFKPEIYLTTLPNDGNLDALLEKIKQYNPICLLAGMEPGVDLAETLCESLGFLRNETKNARVRRDKYLMAKELEKNEILSIPSLKCNNINDILEWKKINNFSEIIVKPVDGAGCENVQLCTNDYQIKVAFNNILGKINVMGITNEYVIAQKYMSGNEYMVNSVSYMGTHFITDIWLSVKNKNLSDGIYYLYNETLINKDDPIYQQLKNYHEKILDCLGIVNGPAHAEIMVTKQGPVLIEVGARISGGENRLLSKEVFGYSSIDLTVDVYTNPRKFLSFIKQQPHNVNTFINQIMLRSDQAKYIKSLPLKMKIESLESFRDIKLRYQPGDLVPKTVDHCTMTGTVMLMHQDSTIIENDRKWILENMHCFYEYEN